MPAHVQLLTFLIVVAGVTAGVTSRHEKEDKEPREGWSHLVLAQSWPQSVCKKLQSEHLKCYVPDSVKKSWTIHGLWTYHRESCNDLWPFQIANIQDLVPYMNEYWPALKASNSTFFWSREWSRHGTCAAQLSALGSQHKYFAKAIELYQMIDVAGALGDAGIYPSHGKGYKFKHVLAAISAAFGVTPKIMCLDMPRFQDAQMLSEIHVCWTKDFLLVDCSKVPDFNAAADKRGNPQSGPAGALHCNPTKWLFYPDISMPAACL
ncbi:unnamed protein product [Lampetra planeri]